MLLIDSKPSDTSRAAIGLCLARIILNNKVNFATLELFSLFSPLHEKICQEIPLTMFQQSELGQMNNMRRKKIHLMLRPDFRGDWLKSEARGEVDLGTWYREFRVEV